VLPLSSTLTLNRAPVFAVGRLRAIRFIVDDRCLRDARTGGGLAHWIAMEAKRVNVMMAVRLMVNASPHCYRGCSSSAWT
jgi:hypothetical protein